MGGDEDHAFEEDYPSDTSTDSGSDCQDTGVYDDGYADPHYKPCRTSNDVDYGRFDSYWIYTEGFDSTDCHFLETRGQSNTRQGPRNWFKTC